jgi:futalosine hydrolase
MISESNRDTFTGKRILIMTAVAVERDAVLRGLQGDSRFDVLLAGVGPASAAVRTAAALTAAEYGLVVSAGIGGGFVGRAAVGTLAVADRIVAADLGAETAEGFSSLEDLGFGSASIAADAAIARRVAEALEASGLQVQTGPVLTLSTVTGSAATAAKLAARVPGAVAEAMEGFGVATAAAHRGIAVLEIRAISNLVGPRDRAAWRIGEALAALEAASKILVEDLR